jgi:dynamin-binding protein
MTPDDVRIIFSNIEELARFSDDFGELLEDALGSLIDGGVGEDHVGALFLEIVCSPPSYFSFPCVLNLSAP